MGLKKAHGIGRVEVEKAQCEPDIHIAPINLGPPPPVDSTQPPRFNNIPMEDIDTSTIVGDACSEVASWARFLRKDRQPVATKILTGRGAPPRTKAIVDALSGKQFQRSGPLTFPPCPPLPPDESAISESLPDVIKSLQSASKNTTSIGFFGWAMDMLYHASHRKHDPQSVFIYQLARLVLLIVKADVRPPLAYLFPGSV